MSRQPGSAASDRRGPPTGGAEPVTTGVAVGGGHCTRLGEGLHRSSRSEGDRRQHAAVGADEVGARRELGVRAGDRGPEPSADPVALTALPTPRPMA